jgi:lactoylglutathione lyase
VPTALSHVAIWTRDLERSRIFFERYFGAEVGPIYRSRRRNDFASYFLEFPLGGARLELMTLPTLTDARSHDSIGYAHIALSLGSRAAVDALTARMRDDGVRILSEPRTTGDGYYEAVVEDPDGNEIELTV